MPLYFNIVTQDYEDISTALSFYLIKINDKYKFVASASTTYTLNFDEITRITSFWRISRKQVLDNIPELFPGDGEIRTAPFTKNEVQSMFGFDPENT